MAEYPHRMTSSSPAHGSTLVTRVMVLPTGTDPDQPDWDNLRNFALEVSWRGPRTSTGRGGYAVTLRGGHRELSRAGNWAWCVEPFRQRLYRWETLEEAVAAARAAVDDVKVNGRTWAEWSVVQGKESNNEG